MSASVTAISFRRMPNSKSASALPHHPEIDPRRRSGIRHFSNVSLPTSEPIPASRPQVKYRSVSAFPFTRPWKRPLNKSDKSNSPEDTKLTKEWMSLPTVQNVELPHNQLCAVSRRPVPIYDPTSAPLIQMPCQQLPRPQPLHPKPTTTATSRRYVTTKIPSIQISLDATIWTFAITVGALFFWFFMFDIIKVGGIAGSMILTWSAVQYYIRTRMEHHELELLRQGRLRSRTHYHGEQQVTSGS
jgi:hypothetical protein